jgi:holo-[acyl-carrier protein] synthase
VCDITRIAAALDRHGDRFAQRVLGPNELRVFEARRSRVARRGLSYLATRFSAKEAFSKAIGLGMRAPMSWRSCEVINAPSGKPEIHLHGALAQWFEERQLRAFVSVSDEANVATAFVVVEKAPAP